MSQPTKRYDDLEAVLEPDTAKGEFWIANPWRVFETDKNLSAFEPNQIFLNVAPGSFADISYLTGADSDGDGRGVMVADVTGDLQPDLLVRQSGGGALRVYANRFPPSSRLVVSLEGTTSNKLGIGSTLVAEADGKKIMRQLFPTNNFITTQASQVSFGLGKASSVDRLVVTWPSGTVQELTKLPVGLHILITEGKPGYRVLQKQRDEPGTRLTTSQEDAENAPALANVANAPLARKSG